MAEQLGMNVNQIAGKINKMREAGQLPAARMLARGHQPIERHF